MQSELTLISRRVRPSSNGLHPFHDVIDRLCSEFNERVSDEQVRQVVQQVAQQYQDARTTMFIPIFIYREARQTLENEGHKNEGAL